MHGANVLPPIVNSAIHRAEVLAIEALDDLTGKLIKTHSKVPAEFLDWVGSDATHLARQLVHECMKDERFARCMQSSQAEVTILRLIHETVMPIVQHQFNKTVVSRSRRVLRAVSLNHAPVGVPAARLDVGIAEKRQVIQRLQQ